MNYRIILLLALTLCLLCLPLATAHTGAGATGLSFGISRPYFTKSRGHIRHRYHNRDHDGAGNPANRGADHCSHH